MAEDDGGLLSAFLNVKKQAGGVKVLNPDNPVNWFNLFGAIASGITTLFLSGVAQIPLSIAEGFNTIINGVLDLLTGTETQLITTPDGGIAGSIPAIDGVFDVLLGVGEFATAVWSAPLDRYGLIGLPVSFGILLATTYVFVQGTRKAYSVLLGGEVF